MMQIRVQMGTIFQRQKGIMQKHFLIYPIMLNITWEIPGSPYLAQASLKLHTGLCLPLEYHSYATTTHKLFFKMPLILTVKFRNNINVINNRLIKYQSIGQVNGIRNKISHSVAYKELSSKDRYHPKNKGWKKYPKHRALGSKQVLPF